MECFDHSIQLNPDYTNAYLNKGNIYLKNKMYLEGIEQFDECIKRSPKMIEALMNKG